MKQKRVFSMIMAAAMMVSPLTVSAAVETAGDPTDKVTGNVVSVGNVDTKPTNKFFKVVLPIDQATPYDYVVDPFEEGRINSILKQEWEKTNPVGSYVPKHVIFTNILDKTFGTKPIPGSDSVYSEMSDTTVVANVGSADVIVTASVDAWTMNPHAVLSADIEAFGTAFGDLSATTPFVSGTRSTTWTNSVNGKTSDIKVYNGVNRTGAADPDFHQAVIELPAPTEGTTWVKEDKLTHYNTTATTTDWKTVGDVSVAGFRITADASGNGWTSGQASRIVVEWNIVPDYWTLPSVEKSGIIAWADGTASDLKVGYDLGAGDMEASAISSIRWVYGRDNQQVEMLGSGLVRVEGKEIVISAKALQNLYSASTTENVEDFYYLPALFVVTFDLKSGGTVEDSFWVGIR